MKGIIQYIERSFGVPVHWIVCLLHMNELPFRALFKHLDGETSGPKAFKGPIGKILAGVNNIPVCKFKQVYSDNLPVLPEDIIKDLSTDQQYLYEMCHAIQSGKCSSSLQNKSPGTLVHSRFLTTANATLRLYVSTKKPSKELQTLVKFIITVYAPLWFQIKWKSNVADGPKHVFMMIKSIKENMPKNLQSLLLDVVQRNSYFAHSENVILSMLVNEESNVRNKAVNLIRQLRSVEQAKGIRKFMRPEINTDAQIYYEIVDLKNMQNVFEPPLLKEFSIEVITECIHTHENFVSVMIKNIPCHTQAVERVIQTVSRASNTVFGEKNRHSKVCATLQSRAILPQTKSKKDYQNYLKS